MIDQEDLQLGYAHQVAPTYQQQTFLGCEVVPASTVLVGAVGLVARVPTWTGKGVVVVALVFIIALMRFIHTEIDPKFFSLKNGFSDAGYYLGGSFLLEYVRALRRWKWF